MAIELKVPEVGESITEVMIGTWKKGVGEQVVADESVVEIESDKATVELPGVISQILKQAGEQATVGEVIGYLDTVGAAAPTPVPPAASPSQAPQPQSVDVRRREGSTMIGSVQPAASGAGPVMRPACLVKPECPRNRWQDLGPVAALPKVMPWRQWRGRPSPLRRLHQPPPQGRPLHLPQLRP